MTIAFKSQFSFIEGGHVFASNLKIKTKQNKKKPKKETIKRFNLRKKKTKQNNNNKNRNIVDSLLCRWFRCFYDDRYSGGGVVEKSNSDSVRRKTAHTVIPRWTL